jgi:hypothetical protein
MDEKKLKLAEYNKAYNQDPKNKDKLKEIAQRSKEKNKDKISERKKIAYLNMDTKNKELLSEQQKIYRTENKDELREKRRIWAKEKYTCECGKQCRNDVKNDHLKTKTHLKIMSEKK